MQKTKESYYWYRADADQSRCIPRCEKGLHNHNQKPETEKDLFPDRPVCIPNDSTRSQKGNIQLIKNCFAKNQKL